MTLHYLSYNCHEKECLLPLSRLKKAWNLIYHYHHYPTTIGYLSFKSSHFSRLRANPFEAFSWPWEVIPLYNFNTCRDVLSSIYTIKVKTEKKPRQVKWYFYLARLLLLGSASSTWLLLLGSASSILIIVIRIEEVSWQVISYHDTSLPFL